jgi:hypothetical protein
MRPLKVFLLFNFPFQFLFFAAGLSLRTLHPH